jgi:uncharacterized protein
MTNNQHQDGEPIDWTLGGQSICLQRCTRCAHTWTFRRDFCPACGAPEPRVVAIGGGGRVYAITQVHRAPDERFKAIAPYTLALIELDEGPRLMTHADEALRIGDAVHLSVRTIAGRLLPHASKIAVPLHKDPTE